jgi:hypothetical protein
MSEGWRRGWDSHHCCVLETKNLQDFAFLAIRQIRSKTETEARIEHAGRPGSNHGSTTTRPRNSGVSTRSCAVTMSSSGKRSAISKPLHPAVRASLRSCAAAVFASGGKSSLPTKHTRMFLNRNGQKGIAGVSTSVAYVAMDPRHYSPWVKARQDQLETEIRRIWTTLDTATA